MISKTGIWEQSEADYAHAFSYGVARFISKYFEKDIPVIDIGCGKATYLEYLQDVGFKSLIGIEGSLLNNFDYPLILNYDLTKPLPVYIKKGNVISIEVFEHIPVEYENQFVENILTCCNNKLIISVAVERQPGLGHVNCRNNDYVITLFENKGFRFYKEATASIRTVVDNHTDYLRNTLMIFEKI